MNLSGASFQAAVFLAPDVRIHWNGTSRTHTPLTGVAVDNTSTAHTGDLVNVVQRGDSTPYSELIASFQDVPFITSSNDNVALHTGDIANGVATNDPTPLMSGTAEANIQVSLYDGTVLLGTTTANSLGVWTFTPTLVGDRVHVITVKATDAAGNVSNASEVWNVNLDTSAPTVRTITASNDNVALYTGDIASGTATNDATPLMSGTAEFGSLVSIYDGTVLLGTTTASALGTTTASALGSWSFTPTLVGDSTHAITITSTDAAGNVSLASTTWNVVLDTTAPVFTTTGATSANENIASGTVIYTPAATDAHGITYAITGGADSALFTIDAATGRVSLNFTPDYEAPVDATKNNVYEFTITATDLAGNQTTQNATFTVNDVTEYKNYIINGGYPNSGWTLDVNLTFTDFAAPTENSTLTSGPFQEPNTVGSLYIYRETDGSLAPGGVAAIGNTVNLVNGKGYDFAFDVKIQRHNNNFAGNSQWVFLDSNNNVVAVIPNTLISTGDTQGAAPGAVIPQNETWTLISSSFVSNLPTGDYKIALEWIATTTPNYHSDALYDRFYLGDSKTATGSIPPLTFDLNHDNHITYTNAFTDLNGNGQTHTTAWVGKEDGVLIWDKYHDNQVHDSSQYAFAQYLKGAKTDLEGLKAFDTNGDGKIGSGDAAWTDMRIWQDLNQNGVSDAGEVKTLADWGITSIDLKSDGVATNPATGVHETGKTSATLTDGTKMVVADVAFDTATTDNGGAVAHPFVIDLNHDGQISYGKELIDVSGAGAAELTAWAGRGDGVLVWDKYHDNQLHDSSQYSFGSLSGANAAMQGLKIFDTNADGKLDSHDVLWNELGIWQIGVDGAGSMKTLAQLGIESISLTSDGKTAKPADGVTEAGRTTATMTNGDTLLVADAIFSHVAIDSTYDQNQHRVI